MPWTPICVSIAKRSQVARATRGTDLLVFGFTFMVWQDFYLPLRDAGIDLSRAMLVHSGGWKKLQEQSISNAVFKGALRDAFGIERVHNYYGMVEQVGSVFFECPAGYLSPSELRRRLIRDQVTWEIAPVRTNPASSRCSACCRGAIPGHSLLTEDIGIVRGVDDCPCGRMGRRFKVIGRVPKAEIRGCSDTNERSQLTRSRSGRPRQPTSWTLEQFVADVGAETPRLPPFSVDAIDLCRALSERFLRARPYPAVVALGYWLRQSSIAAMRERFCALESADAILVPRGTVLHVTPANVDTMFVYSWILALLAGNANVVRLSRETETRTWMLRAIGEVLADPRFEQLRRRKSPRHVRARRAGASRTLGYRGRARGVGRRRDGKPRESRAVPVRSRDVTFPDRHSMAILDVDAVSAATDEELERFAEELLQRCLLVRPREPARHPVWCSGPQPRTRLRNWPPPRGTGFMRP